MTTSRLTNSISPAIVRHVLFMPFVLICLALSPMVRAVSPAPDGGYPSANTAEGTDALFSLTTGVANTAIGFDALFSNTSGNNNTANGSNALFFNTTGAANIATGNGALQSNTTGNGNIALGFQAGFGLTTGVTPSLAFRRSSPTPRAAITSRSVISRVIISAPATITSILAILVLRPKLTPSASAVCSAISAGPLTPRLSSRVSVESPCQALTRW